MTDLNEHLIPLLYAIDEDRSEDAISISVAATQRSAEHVAALLITACKLGLIMRSHPTMSLQQIETTFRFGGTGDDALTEGDIALEFLDALDGHIEADEYTKESDAIIDRYNRRPGSAAPFRVLRRLVNMMLADLRAEMMAPEDFRRSPGAIIEYVKANARSIHAGQGQIDRFGPDHRG